MTNREACIVLNLLPGIGPVKVQRLMECYPNPCAILKEKSSILAKIKGIGEKLASAISNWQNHCDLEHELETTKRAGVNLVTLVDQHYPVLLREIYDPPICLYVRGKLEALNPSFPIAIVGSRRTTRYGSEIAAKLTASLVKFGGTIISGLARGIDTVAHQSCLQHKGVTLAILGGGLGHIYPQENIPLARSICENGALISEFPMLAKPDRKHFPMRNRIIAGLCQGALIVEAGARSGSLITAQQALDHGRMVFAVPGRVDSPQSRGCHYLIKEGAKLVETVDDILDEFTIFSEIQKSDKSDQIQRSSASVDLNSLKVSNTERIILELLGENQMSLNEISEHTKISVQNLLSTLLGLEIRRLIVQLPGKRFCLFKHN